MGACGYAAMPAALPSRSSGIVLFHFCMMLHSIMRLAATSLCALDMPKPEASQLLQAVEGLIDSVKMGVGVASKSVLATGLRCVCV
jgi:hypothetical protein